MSDYPFKRILLATEHTEFDTGAERLAFEMARRCGLPLMAVLPVVSNPEFEIEAPQLAERNDREAANNVNALRNTAKQFGIKLEVHVRHGEEPYLEIVNEAKEKQADLIITRRRGKRSFLEKLLVGEMVSKVIRDASCAVLTVPRAAEFWRHEILAAISDLPAAQNITTLAATIAAACNLPLTIVSVAENQAMQANVEIFNDRNVALASAHTSLVKGRVLIGKPVSQVLAIAKEMTADLIVIGRQRYNFIPFSLGGTSIMQQIAGAMDVPTLIVPA